MSFVDGMFSDTSHAQLTTPSSYILTISGDHFYGKLHRRLRDLNFNSFIAVPENALMEHFDHPDPTKAIEERRYIWKSDSLFQGLAAMNPTLQVVEEEEDA